MTKKTASAYVQPYRYPSPNIPLAAIRRFARKIAERFHPDKIILFGSYAYGTPHAESDVDLLVIMPARNVIDQAIRICCAIERDFSLDLIVRTPSQIARGLKMNNWFLREIVEKGKVVYEAHDETVGADRRGRLAGGAKPRKAKDAASKPSLLSLPTVGRKIPQGATSGPRRARAENT
jgi:predicted nucleotidyltransferase